MNLEIVPVSRSCELDCPSCPFSRKSRDVLLTEIDPEVQKTFSLIEKVLMRNNKKYNFASGYSPEILPAFNYPKLVALVRVKVGQNENARDFSEKFKYNLERNHLSPKHLGFSLKPHSPLVGKEEAMLVKNILEEMSSWHFTSKYKKLSAYVTSNLVKESIFDEISSVFEKNDKEYFNTIIKNFKTLGEFKANPVFKTENFGSFYSSTYEARVRANKVFLTNRVIGQVAREHSSELDIQNALMFTPTRSKSLSPLITPDGVMLIHISLEVNNPVLWMSHDDFRDSLELFSKRYRNYFFLKFTRDMLVQNSFLYGQIKKSGEHMSLAQAKDFYQMHRKYLMKR